MANENWRPYRPATRPRLHIEREGPRGRRAGGGTQGAATNRHAACGAWEGGGARQRMMSPESSSAQRGARVATTRSPRRRASHGIRGLGGGMGIQHSRWDFLFFLRQGRLPEGCARLEGEASGRWVTSACYSAPLRPSRVLHAPHQPPTPTQTVARPAGFPQLMVRSAPPTEAMIRFLLCFKTPASDSQQGTLPGLGLPNLLRIGNSGL